MWPCYFFKSDTTGEKDFEEFFTDKEDIDIDRFETIGVIKNRLEFNSSKLDNFNSKIESFRNQRNWTKQDILDLFLDILPELDHKETGKYLDQRM